MKQLPLGIAVALRHIADWEESLVDSNDVGVLRETVRNFHYQDGGNLHDAYARGLDVALRHWLKRLAG